MIIFIKYIIMAIIFFTCFIIGNLISQKYILRVKELNEFKNALNIVENKIKFTYESIPEIFNQVSKMLNNNVSKIFVQAGELLKSKNAEEAWNDSLENITTNLTKEDIENIRNFGKMLGKTDKEGQISQIELTKTFIDMQIEKAKAEEEKNAKLYKTLGTIVGLACIIILI